jgi:hypothetical protein
MNTNILSVYKSTHKIILMISLNVYHKKYSSLLIV